MKDAHRKRWLYQATRVCTQTAGGGGVLAVRISLPTGVSATIASGHAIGPATNSSLVARFYDEDGAIGPIYAITAAAVSATISLPAIGSAQTSTNTPGATTNATLGPGEYLAFYSGAAAALNETLTVNISLLLSAPITPTWDTTGSAGTPSLAASTISAVNTLQLVIE